MNEQMIARERKERNLKSNHKKSKILFIIFLTLFCLSMLTETGITRTSYIFLFSQLAGLIFLGFHFFFFPAYIMCIIASIIIGLSEYRRIFIFDIIGALITIAYLTLNLTGFCYKEFKYLSKQEIVDAAFERTLEACNKYNDKCPSYQEIKQ